VPNVTPLRAEDPDRVGRYRLSGRISGMPGTGPVFVASAVSGPEVAVRLLRGSWTRNPAERDRFAAEASSAARVPPFCAARIVDAGVVDDYVFLVSEYVAGRSLLEAVSDDGPFPGLELEAVAIGSATGLASVHQAGLVHGNFGPEYVVMSASGPRVIEYGITPPYGSATPSADMLAWAQTMVFAAIGRPPATFADLDSLPVALREAVAECLSGDPALRPSARSIAADLLGGTLPAERALPEGARRAALAARSDDVPARDLASLGAGHAGGSSAGHAGRGPAGGGHGTGRSSRASGGRAGPDPAARRRTAGAAPHRRGLVPAVVAGIVVIAVIAVVIVRVLGSAGPGGQAQGGASPPAASTSPASARASRSPASSTPGTITVPAAFSGSWAGQARQVNPPDEFHVRLTLPAGAADGSVAYSNASISCVGQLSPDSFAGGTLTLDQGITAGRHTCADGTVTLTGEPDGRLKFTFRGKKGPAATGTLAEG
jgi:eukaryotic-like serine/threonine-protein kinase